jgi:hypothetical protein
LILEEDVMNIAVPDEFLVNALLAMFALRVPPRAMMLSPNPSNDEETDVVVRKTKELLMIVMLMLAPGAAGNSTYVGYGAFTKVNILISGFWCPEYNGNESQLRRKVLLAMRMFIVWGPS